jgi:hypothetical protein
MIFVTGDTHGELNLRKLASSTFPEGNNLTKDDYVIICGDFGLLWYPPGHRDFRTQEYWLNWLENKPWTTLFVDGNHENFDLLLTVPQKKMFGAPVGVVSNSIFHLKRGYVYTIQGKSFFAFGGGNSIDKEYRMPYRSWWPDELPHSTEYLRGLNNLIAHNKSIDYIITHACPGKLVRLLYERSDRLDPEEEKPLREYFDYISELIQFKKWYFGHYHIDRELEDKYRALYNSIIQIE